MQEIRAELRKLFLHSLGMLVLTGMFFVTPGLAQPMFDGLYVLDGNGNVHTVDNAPVITSGIDFGFDIAKDIALTGNETGFVTGAYLLTGVGDVFGFGDADLYPAQTDRPYFGWDIARDMEPAVDWTQVKNGQAGFYVLDGFGGVFPVGDLTRPYFKVYPTHQSLGVGETRYLYWGWDVAEDLEVTVTYAAGLDKPRVNGYYVLDALGGVHWNIEDDSGNIAAAPWAGFDQPYFGWDIARGLAVTASAQGYFLLDGYGGLHTVGDALMSFPSGGAAVEELTTPFFAWDIAKDLELVYDDVGELQGLIVLDGYGGLHEVGNVQIQNPLPLFDDGLGNFWDIARDMEISPFYSFITEAVVTGP